MTRNEFSNNRELFVSQWIREKLPDSSTGFMVTDLDWILSNYKTKKIMLLEVKTRTGNIKIWQRNIFNNLNHWIQKGIDDEWIYLGFHLLQLSCEKIENSILLFDGKTIEEDELIKKLSF